MDKEGSDDGLAIACRELQATHDELQRTVGELQSVTDELELSAGDLRHRQDEIERLNGLLVAVLDSLTSAVAVLDADLTVLAWNRRAAELWGMGADETVGEHLPDLGIGLPLDELGQARQVQMTVDRPGGAIEVQVRLTHLAGQSAHAPAAVLVMDAAGTSG